MDLLCSQQPIPIQALTLPKRLRLLVLAPHPDDFDAIGVTLRFFLEKKNLIYLAVATSGANGVEDTFCLPPTPETKRHVREEEQKASCRFFGLPQENLEFLHLATDGYGRLSENEPNIKCLRQHLLSKRPDLVFLPHWHDPNLTHQRVYAMFRQTAVATGIPTAAFLNRDPKTIKMQCHLYMGFDGQAAIWKRKLLRFHRSQQQRNLNRRGYGMDERILSMDRQSAKACSLDSPYAEVFELEIFGAEKLEDVIA